MANNQKHPVKLKRINSKLASKKTQQPFSAPVERKQLLKYSSIIKKFLSCLTSDVLRMRLRQASASRRMSIVAFLQENEDAIVSALGQLKSLVIFVYPSKSGLPDLSKWSLRLLCIVLKSSSCLNAREQDDVTYIEKMSKRYFSSWTDRPISINFRRGSIARRDWIRVCGSVQRLVENVGDENSIKAVRNFVCKVGIESKTAVQKDSQNHLEEMISMLISSNPNSKYKTDTKESTGFRKQKTELTKLKRKYDLVSRDSSSRTMVTSRTRQCSSLDETNQESKTPPMTRTPTPQKYSAFVEKRSNRFVTHALMQQNTQSLQPTIEPLFESRGTNTAENNYLCTCSVKSNTKLVLTTKEQGTETEQNELRKETIESETQTEAKEFGNTTNLKRAHASTNLRFTRFDDMHGIYTSPPPRIVFSRQLSSRSRPKSARIKRRPSSAKSKSTSVVFGRSNTSSRPSSARAISVPIKPDNKIPVASTSVSLKWPDNRIAPLSTSSVYTRQRSHSADARLNTTGLKTSGSRSGSGRFQLVPIGYMLQTVTDTNQAINAHSLPRSSDQMHTRTTLSPDWSRRGSASPQQRSSNDKMMPNRERQSQNLHLRSGSTDSRRYVQQLRTSCAMPKPAHRKQHPGTMSMHSSIEAEPTLAVQLRQRSSDSLRKNSSTRPSSARLQQRPKHASGAHLRSHSADARPNRNVEPTQTKSDARRQKLLCTFNISRFAPSSKTSLQSRVRTVKLKSRTSIKRKRRASSNCAEADKTPFDGIIQIPTGIGSDSESSEVSTQPLKIINNKSKNKNRVHPEITENEKYVKRDCSSDDQSQATDMFVKTRDRDKTDKMVDSKQSANEDSMKKIANDVLVHQQTHVAARDPMLKDKAFVDHFFKFLHDNRVTKKFLRTTNNEPHKTWRLPNGSKATFSFFHAFIFRHIAEKENDTSIYVVQKMLHRMQCSHNSPSSEMEENSQSPRQTKITANQVSSRGRSRDRVNHQRSRPNSSESKSNTPRGNQRTPPQTPETRRSHSSDPHSASSTKPTDQQKSISAIMGNQCWKCNQKNLAMTICVNWRNESICRLLLADGVPFREQHLVPAVRANELDILKRIVTYLKEHNEWFPGHEDVKEALYMARYHKMKMVVEFLEQEGVRDERKVVEKVCVCCFNL